MYFIEFMILYKTILYHVIFLLASKLYDNWSSDNLMIY